MSHHRSDNLYSALNDVVDDDEASVGGGSFSNELTPSDGYFNQSQMPDAMVQDPSVDTKEVEPKTLMPTPVPRARKGAPSRTSLGSILSPSNASASHNDAALRPGNNSSTSPSSYTPRSPVAAIPRRREPLLPGRSLSINGPPPAYSPPQSPASPETNRAASYNTFARQPLERSPLPVREPESMGRPSEDPSEITLLPHPPPRDTPFQSLKRSLLSREKRRNVLTKVLLVALVFIIITMLITMSFGDSTNHDDIPKSPGSSPAKEITTPEDLPSSASYCSQSKHHFDVATYDLPGGDDLAIIQSVQKSDWSGDSYVKVDTHGELRLRRVPKSSNADNGFITVDIYVTDPSLSVTKEWNDNSKAFEVKTPRFAPATSTERQCISLEITAWLPEDAEFVNLDFEAVTLTLRVMDDIKISIKESSNFDTVSGDVVFPKDTVPYSSVGIASSPAGQDASIETVITNQEAISPFSSRWIHVKTISGDIAGSYPLRDYLGISSQSGTINVLVNPQAALPSSPAPATLDIYTSSSSITAHLPIVSSYTPPPRNYITKVHSQSGTISGSYYLGSSSLFQSTSGDMKITALPILEYSAAERSNKFETSTVSGTTNVNILDPIFLTLLEGVRPTPFVPVGDKDPYLLLPPYEAALYGISDDFQKTPKMRSLDAKHATTSGDVNVRYPTAWEGVLSAKSVSGSIDATGKGLIIVGRDNGYGSKGLLAYKGVDDTDSGGRVVIGGVSGSLRFDVGV